MLDECLVSEAFMDSDVRNNENGENQETVPIMEEPDSLLHSPQEAQRSALQTTLGVASSAVRFVLFPYVFAGKAAVHATSTAVQVPLHLTNQLRASITQSWTRSGQEEVDTDRFGEDRRGRTSATNDLSRRKEQVIGSLVSAETVSTGGEDGSAHESGVVSQLLYLPGRLVHNSVSKAVAIPTRFAVYSGRKLSGAVSTSHALATSAVVASTSGVARSGMHVARGITHGAVSTVSFTVSIISGAMEASVRTVGYVIPPSVSNAVWQGMDITGNASINVLSHAIAVPSYRMLQALIPALSNCFSEEEVVKETRTVVKMLMKLLGPQNAFYLLKWVYDTVNSDEAHDAFLLCGDIFHESLDGENYRHAGASVGAATGLPKVVNLMKEACSVLPSFDELLDAVVLVADISDEVVDGVVHAVTKERDSKSWDESRFKYVDDDEESWTQGLAELKDATFDHQESTDHQGSSDHQGSTLSSEEELSSLYESGLSLLTRACDSEEASSLFNTFGDFLDVLLV